MMGGERESGNMLSRGSDHKNWKMEKPDVLFLQPTEEALEKGRQTRSKGPKLESNPG